MDDKVCDLLRNNDNLFTKEIVDVSKFNKTSSLKNRCPYDETSKEYKCTSNNDRINAVSANLYNKIIEIDKAYKNKNGVSRHIEIFMMWLGDKLFRIDKDYKATLEESYEKNLEKSMGNLNYWKAIDSKKIYKKATIKKMSEYYSLLNYICKLITEYNKNEQNPSRKLLGNYASQCDNFYKTIHNSINGCKPYIQLLDDLKMIYEIFRLQRIDIQSKLNNTDKNLLLNRVKSLTTFKKENRYFMTVNAILSFDDKECVEVKSNDEKIGEQIALQKSKTPTRGAQTRVSGNAQRENIGSRKLGSSQPKRPPAQPTTLKSPPAKQTPSPPPPPANPTPPLTPSQKDTKLKTSQTRQTHQNGPGGTVIGAGDGKGDPGGGASGGKGDAGSGVNGGGSVQGDQGKSSGVTGSGPDGQGKLSGGAGSGPGSQGGSGNQVNTDSQTKLSGNLPQGNPVLAQPATVPSGTGTPQSAGTIPPTSAPTSSVSQSPPVSQSSSVSPPSSPSSPSSPQSSTPNVPTSQDPAALPQAPPDQKPPDQKPQVQQQDPPPADPPVPPPQTGGSSRPNEPKNSDNAKGNKNGASDNTGGTSSGSKDPGGKSSDPASNTSGGSFNLGSSLFGSLFNGVDKFNKASKFVKENHQKFKDAKDKISGTYNSAVDNLKSAYSASSDYLNKYVSNIIDQLNQVDPPKSGGGNSHNQLQSPQPPSTTDPSNPSNPSTPTKDPKPPSPPTPPQINPPDPPPNPIPNSKLNTTQNPSKGSSQQKQSSTQSQPTQINSSSQQTVVQFVKSLSSNPNLKKTWNIFPTTWNGSGDCKPEIKFINTTLVCCTSEQCSLTGILITLVLIPIILSIAYKYLPFGSSKKSEKKNMKRVINFHDGNRKTKIIISSNNRNKNLKPVINLVDGKKDSLINIYKIIQADPMPFINLFFLLIFFVYKRKRDTIE